MAVDEKFEGPKYIVDSAGGLHARYLAQTWLALLVVRVPVAVEQQ